MNSGGDSEDLLNYKNKIETKRKKEYYDYFHCKTEYHNKM